MRYQILMEERALRHGMLRSSVVEPEGSSVMFSCEFCIYHVSCIYIVNESGSVFFLRNKLLCAPVGQGGNTASLPLAEVIPPSTSPVR